MNQVAITDMIQDVDGLEAMPVSIKKLADVAANPNARIDDIVEAIRYDQALTADLLRAANSAWSGAARTIETVQQAVVRLGFSWVLGLMTGKHVRRKMVEPCAAYQLAEKELWRHSLAAALAASKMGSVAEKEIPPSAFTVALMHDIGKRVLANYLDTDLVNRIFTLIQEGMCYIDAEREVLGTDHAIVGGMVARHWQFPETFINAIEHHHDPDAEPCVMLDVVHVANIVAKILGIGLGTEQMNMACSDSAVARLGISSEGLESLCAITLEELQKTEGLFETA